MMFLSNGPAPSANTHHQLQANYQPHRVSIQLNGNKWLQYQKLALV